MGGYYICHGKLIGYATFTKDNEQFHTYHILMGEGDKVSGLYDNVTHVKITQEEQTLKEIKNGRKVFFENRIQNGRQYFCNVFEEP